MQAGTAQPVVPPGPLPVSLRNSAVAAAEDRDDCDYFIIADFGLLATTSGQ